MDCFCSQSSNFVTGVKINAPCGSKRNDSSDKRSTFTGTPPEHDEKQQETPVIEVHEEEAVTSPFSELHENEASSLVTVSGEADTTEFSVIKGDTPTTELTVTADGSVQDSELSAPVPMNRPVDVQGSFLFLFLFFIFLFFSVLG